MTLDTGDWIAAISAVIALASTAVAGISLRYAHRSALASEKSADASKLSAHAAERSALAGERANELAEGEAASQLAGWKAEKVPGSATPIFGTGRARLVNVGDEVALNVRVHGDRIERKYTTEAVYKGEFIEFSYSIDVENPSIFDMINIIEVVWERPRQFGGSQHRRTLVIDED